MDSPPISFSGAGPCGRLALSLITEKKQTGYVSVVTDGLKNKIAGSTKLYLINRMVKRMELGTPGTEKGTREPILTKNQST